MSRNVLPFALKFRLGKFIERNKTALLQMTRAEAHQYVAKELNAPIITIDHYRRTEDELGLKRQTGGAAVVNYSGKKTARVADLMISMNARIVAQGFESPLKPEEIAELQAIAAGDKPK
jgi:hypothetical protein